MYENSFIRRSNKQENDLTKYYFNLLLIQFTLLTRMLNSYFVIRLITSEKSVTSYLTVIHVTIIYRITVRLKLISIQNIVIPICNVNLASRFSLTNEPYFIFFTSQKELI